MNRAFIGKNNVKKSFATLFQTGCALGRHVWNFRRGHCERVNRTIRLCIASQSFQGDLYLVDVCQNRWTY
jgi:hypothetical protein